MTVTRPRQPRASSAVGATMVATLCTTSAVLPVFLFGGLSTLARADIAISPRALGMVAGVFFAAAALASVPGGRLAERYGALRTLYLGVGLAASSLAGIALLATRPIHILALMVVGGASNGLTQPASNLALTRLVPRQHHGIAFGVKQAAIPLSTLLAGAAVPAVGLTLGWRWAFGAAALLTLPLAATMRRYLYEPSGSSPSHHARPAVTTSARRTVSLAGRRLWPVAVAGGCGTAAANTLGAFYVESAVTTGIDVGVAGTLLSVGSVTGIAARLLLGRLADRLQVDQFKIVSAMIGLGVLGYLGVGHLNGLGWLLPATIVAFGAGWGWPGLLHLAVVRENADAPAAASGFTQTGLYLGGVLGPVTFGWVAEASGYAIAWTTTAGIAALGALLLVVRRSPQRDAARHGG